MRDEARPAAPVASQVTPSHAGPAPRLVDAGVPACTADCIAITGVVRDVWGTPLSNATVRARGARASTDATGNFSITVAPEAWLEVHADADGYSTRSLYTDGADPLEFLLAPEATVSGRVVDAATGHPVPHATVSAGEESTTADASGRFSLAVDAPVGRLEAVAPSRRGDMWLSVGFGEHREDVEIEMQVRVNVLARIEQVGPRPCPELLQYAGVREGDRYRIELSPGRHVIEVGCGQHETVVVGDSDLEVTWRVGAGGTVRGRVVFASRALVPATFAVAPISDARNPEWQWQDVDTDGTFASRALAPGRYRLHLRLANGSEQITPPFDLVHGDVVERTIEMTAPPSRPVRGIVRADGRPVANARVELAGNVLQTRANGTFATEFPEGSYVMYVAVAHVVLTEHVEVGEGGAQPEVAYTTPPAEAPPPPRERRRFEGRVIDEHGQPLAGAIVRCEQDIIVADDAGRFRYESEITSPRVEVRADGGSAVTSLDVARVTELRLHRPISGQVLTADGGPARKFTIVVRRASGASEFEVSHTAGRFQIEDDGTPATITAQLAGQVGANTLTLDEGTPRTGLVLRLRATVTVRGRIIDGVTQQPLAGVRIHARPGIEGWATWFLDPKQVTDANGVFAIEYVPLGKLLLELLPPQTTWSDQKITVDVSSGDVGTFTLSRVGRR